MPFEAATGNLSLFRWWVNTKNTLFRRQGAEHCHVAKLCGKDQFGPREGQHQATVATTPWLPGLHPGRGFPSEPQREWGRQGEARASGQPPQGKGRSAMLGPSILECPALWELMRQLWPQTEIRDQPTPRDLLGR